MRWFQLQNCELSFFMYQYLRSSCIRSIYLLVDTIFQSFYFLLRFLWWRVAAQKDYMFHWWRQRVEQDLFTTPEHRKSTRFYGGVCLPLSLVAFLRMSASCMFSHLYFVSEEFWELSQCKKNPVILGAVSVSYLLQVFLSRFIKFAETVQCPGQLALQDLNNCFICCLFE